MSKTVIVFASPSPWRGKIQDLLKQHCPGLRVFLVDSAKALEDKFRVKLFPEVLCILLTGQDKKDIVLYNLKELYLYHRKTRFVFLEPCSNERAGRRLAGETYFEDHLLMPLTPDQVADEIIRKIRNG